MNSKQWQSRSWSERIIPAGPFGAEMGQAERFDEVRPVLALDDAGLETQQQLVDFTEALPTSVQGARELGILVAQRTDIAESGDALVSKVEAAEALGVDRNKLDARITEVRYEGIWDVFDESSRTFRIKLTPWGFAVLEAFLGNAPSSED